jgi:hypothetical protein
LTDCALRRANIRRKVPLRPVFNVAPEQTAVDREVCSPSARGTRCGRQSARRPDACRRRGPKYQPIAFSTSRLLPSGKQHRAALLLADGTKSNREIVAACRINRRTLARWKEQPSFQTRVAEVRTAVFGDIS